MSKLINQPVELCTANGFPLSFYFKRNYRIDYILRHWREAGQWWLREPELHVYEVSVQRFRCELHYLPGEKQWILYRLTD